ncbi:hypothetical protein [Streptomyces hygroscopicus]|uniref:hypothetical protein n=1 Tax=Streptomyces hygroscopicus TaxID=1912 RepID=UPI0004C5A218|nr:hypothetical protein [Streptomyces hygroscopicus]
MVVTGGQLPAEVGEFARSLRALAGGSGAPRGARFAGAYGDEDSGKHRKRDQAANDGRRLVP